MNKYKSHIQSKVKKKNKKNHIEEKSLTWECMLVVLI